MSNIPGNSGSRLIVLRTKSDVLEGVREGRAEGFVEMFVKGKIFDFRWDRSS
jgi:hypothetical protein